MNEAWKYCDNLTAYQTIKVFRRDGLDPDSVDWAFVRELRAALKAAGHPAGAD